MFNKVSITKQIVHTIYTLISCWHNGQRKDLGPSYSVLCLARTEECHLQSPGCRDQILNRAPPKTCRSHAQVSTSDPNQTFGFQTLYVRSSFRYTHRTARIPTLALDVEELTKKSRCASSRPQTAFQPAYICERNLLFLWSDSIAIGKLYRWAEVGAIVKWLNEKNLTRRPEMWCYFVGVSVRKFYSRPCDSEPNSNYVRDL